MNKNITLIIKGKISIIPTLFSTSIETFHDFILELPALPTEELDDNGGTKSSVGEHIVKMSLSESDVNGTFRFSKISLETADTSGEKKEKEAEVDTRKGNLSTDTGLSQDFGQQIVRDSYT